MLFIGRFGRIEIIEYSIIVSRRLMENNSVKEIDGNVDLIKFFFFFLSWHWSLSRLKVATSLYNEWCWNPKECLFETSRLKVAAPIHCEKFISHSLFCLVLAFLAVVAFFSYPLLVNYL